MKNGCAFILNQLISNAVKYRTNQPVLHFYSTRKENHVLLSVADNGIGIAQSDISLISKRVSPDRMVEPSQTPQALDCTFASVSVTNWASG